MVLEVFFKKIVGELKTPPKPPIDTPLVRTLAKKQLTYIEKLKIIVRVVFERDKNLRRAGNRQRFRRLN